MGIKDIWTLVLVLLLTNPRMNHLTQFTLNLLMIHNPSLSRPLLCKYVKQDHRSPNHHGKLPVSSLGTPVDME